MPLILLQDVIRVYSAWSFYEPGSNPIFKSGRNQLCRTKHVDKRSIAPFMLSTVNKRSINLHRAANAAAGQALAAGPGLEAAAWARREAV